MNEETKKRITDINNGIIPEGYKKTKVGIVPVEWKQVKLGEILKQRKTLMCVSEDAPLLSFTIEEGVIEPTDKKTNKRDFLIKDISTKKFALTEVGDIIYNPANLKFGAIHRNNLRKGVVSPIYGIFYGKQDSVFMGNLLHNQRFIDYAKIYTEGTVEKLKTLKAETFLKLKVVIPPLPEQQKIAEILSTQDKLIELQEKKIEQLKELKKAYLQKMFPKKGCKYPKLRFKGFTDAWEQRKLGEVADIVGGGTPSTAISEYWDGDIDWYAPAEISDQIFVNSSQRKITTEGLNNSSAKMLPVGTVLFTSRAGIGKTAILAKEGCTNQGFQSIIPHKNELDSYFIFSRTDELKRYGEIVGAGSTFVEVSGKQMANMMISIPTTMEEQQQIGSYFCNLDNLITLHQRKLDEEKQKKKALMQLLLTGKVRCI